MPGGSGCSARYPAVNAMIASLAAVRASVAEQAADHAAERVAALLRGAARALGDRRVVVGALQADAARAGEAVEDEVAGAAAEQAGLEAIDLLGHLDRVVAVHPAARLDVDRLAGVEHLLEHVAVAVPPDDPLV